MFLQLQTRFPLAATIPFQMGLANTFQGVGLLDVGINSLTPYFCLYDFSFDIFV